MVKDGVYLNKEYLEDLNQNTIKWVQVKEWACKYITLILSLTLLSFVFIQNSKPGSQSAFSTDLVIEVPAPPGGGHH